MSHSDDALRIWRAGVAAVDGYRATAAALDGPPPDLILAVGKAAGAMTRAACGHFGAVPCLVVTKDGHGSDLPLHAELIEACHPVPDARSLTAGRMLSRRIAEMAPGSRVLLLVSGGASSLAEDLQPGVTLRDVVNAIPWVAIQRGLLTVEKANKKNLFNGRIMEIEGLPDLKLEQAFELTDASAERSCAGCTIKLSEDTVSEYLRSNVALLKNMIARGYSDARTLARRIKEMEAWLANPKLMSADADAEYAEVLEINLDELTEPVVACPNDPDNVKLLSEVAGDPVQEVFIGSCMTNIGHYRAAAKVLEGAGQNTARLWVCPPTRMDEETLKEEGYYATFEAAGSRMEMPGCSLCMGNQARVEDNTTVFSTSTRNFNNRLGKGAQVYLGSAELAAVCAQLGRIPTPEEYRSIAAEKIDPLSDELYRYLNFDQITGFEDEGRVVSADEEAQMLAGA